MTVTALFQFILIILMLIAAVFVGIGVRINRIENKIKQLIEIIQNKQKN